MLVVFTDWVLESSLMGTFLFVAEGIFLVANIECRSRYLLDVHTRHRYSCVLVSQKIPLIVSADNIRSVTDRTFVVGTVWSLFG
jgi:hypothetical protein